MAVLVRRRDLSAPPVPRWQPFPEIEQLQEQMGQLMERVMSAEETGAWAPLVDIEETEDAWLVEAEVPGVRNEDVDVEVRDSEIAITGEIKERERQGILRRKTRRVGRFEFRVSLPGQTDAEKVEAALDNGILTVRIPKPEMARPRHVEVRSGNGAEADQPQQATQS
jgi:HSP20 family protein